MSYQKASKQIQSSGIIMPWGATTLPSGWIKCDGQSYLRSEYPDLFSSIGTKFGAADGTHFNVPDLRGMFLRGTNNSRDTSTGDPDNASRTCLCPGGCGGDNPGTFQSDCFCSHYHGVGVWTASYTTAGANARNCGWWPVSGTDCCADKSSINGTSANESRAINIYVYFIIKT